MEIKEQVLALPPKQRLDIWRALGESLIKNIDLYSGITLAMKSADRVYKEYKAKIETIIGQSIPAQGRKQDWVFARSMIVYRLIQEGYTERDIAYAMQRNCSSVHNMKVKIENMLAFPSAYVVEMRLWKKFIDDEIHE